jgi:beta-glucuronidase
LVIRRFSEHLIRRSTLLNGHWDFVKDPQNTGAANKWFESFPTNFRPVPVPGCWNNELELFDYEGVAWYRTVIRLSSPEHIRLIFHAVLGHADIYLDGKHLGYHYGGYTPFEFVLAGLSAGEHELVVRTDSTLDRQTIPIDVVDWFHYGGIIRPVELQMLSDIYIEAFTVRYKLAAEYNEADIEFKVVLRSLSEHNVEVPITLEADGRVFHHDSVSVPAIGVKEVTVRQNWKEIRLWNVGQPELYLFRASSQDDDRADRTGFRRIEVKDKRILINGREVYLQGVNRHEEHPEWGFAFPNKLMTKDLDIIQHMGCNSVRGSHYPQSKYWIDLLDERGIVFWSEIPMWGALMPKEVLAQPLFIQRSLTMMGEMIDRDYHHPSIVFWSVHNEIDTRSQEAYDISVKLTELVRSKDASRLVSYATMHPLDDIVMPLFDVVGINKYHGWYEGKVEEFSRMLQEFHVYAESMGAGDKPVLMTEFGGAGIYGDTGWEQRLFSEDYQSYIVTEALRIFREDPYVSGTYIWQFADTRGDLKSERGVFRDRARSFNNKGLVNEYRKPKLAYRTVREVYREP